MITESIATFAVSGSLPTVDATVSRVATRAFIDTIGVAIAGERRESVRRLSSLIRAETSAAGRCTVLTGGTASATHSALVNGTAGHALDLDDHLSDVMGHPSVVLVPAILAVAEDLKLSGMDMITAYAVGHQVLCAVSAGLPARQAWARGWHTTSIVGVIAATAALSRLRGLTIPRTRHALGLAATLAGGNRQNSGYDGKALNAGVAASGAVFASALAASGWDADPSHLEAPAGYFQLFGCDDADLTRVAPVLGEPWTAATRGLNIKTIPACYAAHPTARAAAGIGEVDANQIARIDVTVQPGGLAALVHHHPQTGHQARFSIEYVVAATLLDGALTSRSFEDALVVRPAIEALLPLISARESPIPPTGPVNYERRYSVVSVTTRTGQVMTCRADVPFGHASDPLTDGELERKFLDCTAGSGWNAAALLDTLWQLRSIPDVSQLLGRFHRPSGAGPGQPGVVTKLAGGRLAPATGPATLD